MDFFKFVLNFMERESLWNVIVLLASVFLFLIYAFLSNAFDYPDYTNLIFVFLIFVVTLFVAFHLIYSAAVAWLYNTLANKAQFRTDSPSSKEIMKARLIRTFTERKEEITIIEPPSFPIEQVVLKIAQKEGLPMVIYASKPFIAMGVYSVNEHSKVTIYTEDTLEGRSLGKNLETTLKHN